MPLEVYSYTIGVIASPNLHHLCIFFDIPLILLVGRALVHGV